MKITKREVKLILENQQVIMNALGNMTRTLKDAIRLQTQIEKTAPFVHGKQVVKHGK